MTKLYWQFLLCRIGVSVGEAALSPAAYSLIADSFPAERRATAISVYSMGVYLGSGLAFLFGGLVIKMASAQGDVLLPVLGEVRPWQLIFVALGAAGVLFTLLILAVKEPTRRGVGADPLGLEAEHPAAIEGAADHRTARTFVDRSTNRSASTHRSSSGLR